MNLQFDSNQCGDHVQGIVSSRVRLPSLFCFSRQRRSEQVEEGR